MVNRWHIVYNSLHPFTIQVFSVNCPGATISYVITALSDSSKQHSIG